MSQPLTEQQLDDYAILAITADHTGERIDPAVVTVLVDEVRKLQQQRRFLIGRLAKKDARSGDGDRALREFLGAEVSAGDAAPAPATAPLAASQPSEVPTEPETATEAPEGLLRLSADRVRALAILEAANFLRDAHFRDGLSVQEIGTALRNTADEADPMVGSLARDGFGLDEIADMLGSEVTPGAHPIADADNPTPLRWGLDDVQWGDDDSITVLLSGPDLEPYRLELDPERAAVLRRNLAGPEGDDTAAPDTLPAWLHQRFAVNGPVSWECLDDGQRAYWEHQARAVRRAVDRGGFKDAAASPAEEATR